MDLTNSTAKEVEKSIADILLVYVNLYEPRMVYLKIVDKTPFNDFLKQQKGQQIAYDFGVISTIPKNNNEEIVSKFCYWKGNELFSAEIKLKDNGLEIDSYISYPKEVFSDLIRTADNYGYFNGMTYQSKPIYFNKY